MVRKSPTSYFPGFAIIAISCLILLYSPIAVLVFYAFNDGTPLTGWTGFSMHWFRAAWNDPVVYEAGIRSFVVAGCASVIATLVAIPAALATTRTADYRGKTLKSSLINLPLIVPEIVTAVGLLILFSRLRVWTGYHGVGYLILAHAAFCVPFTYMPLRARLAGSDLSLERAAADLYASRFQVFRFVTLPLLWPAIAAGAMLSFVISLDDVVITEFIKSAGQETIPTYMLGQIRRGVTPQTNAIAAAFLFVSAFLVMAFYLVNRVRLVDS